MLVAIVTVTLSGAASLMYQVAWTRQLANVTSATATAQAVILTAFMAGLGGGAWWAGRRAERWLRPMRGYAAVETAAAALAIGSIWLVPAADTLRTMLARSGTGSSMALWGQLAGLSLYLVGPCLLMGASTPLVVEHALRRHEDKRGRIISLIYAANTAGAVLGTIGAGFWTVETFGLSATVGFGAALALGAASLAAMTAAPPAASTAAPASCTAATRVEHRELVLVAAAAGFVGLGAEVVWTRLVSLVVLTTVYAYSQVLAGVLIGVVVGSAGAAAILRRHCGPDARAVALRTVSLALAGSAVFIGLGPALVLDVAADPTFERALADGLSVRGARFLLLLVVPAAACTAAVFPLLVSASSALRGADAFGRLYFANTVGSVLGSLAAGFLLLPTIGTQSALLVLEGLALLAAGLVARRAAGRHVVLVPVAAVTAAALFFGPQVPGDLFAARVGADTQILAFREGTHSNVMVTESNRGIRRIWINSAWVAGTGGGHRMLGHLPALFVERPRRAVGIALGTGQTFAAALAHGFAHLDCVEIDGGVIELSTRYFSEANDRLFEQPQVVLHQNDGRAFLRTTQHRFDLVVLEPLQAWSAGTSSLYSEDFYREARAALAPEGVVAQWIPFYGQSPEGTKAMVRAGLEVFANASLWLDANDGILLLHDGAFRLDPARLDARITARGLRDALEANHLSMPRDIIGLFVAGPRGLAAWTDDARRLTDDHPFLEFDAARQIGSDFRSAIVASLRPHLEAPGDYFADTSSVGLMSDALAVRDAVLDASVQASVTDRVIRLETGLDAVADSPLLRAKYEEAILTWAFESPGRALAIYQRAERHAPGLGRVGVNLALLLARGGRWREARRVLEPLREHPRVGRRADALLRRLPRSRPSPASPSP